MQGKERVGGGALRDRFNCNFNSIFNYIYYIIYMYIHIKRNLTKLRGRKVELLYHPTRKTDGVESALNSDKHFLFQRKARWVKITNV